MLIDASPLLADVTGRYFEDCDEAAVLGPRTADIPAHDRGDTWYALDPGNAARLWELSEKATA